MLVTSQVQKFGALAICGTIVSLILAIMGHPWLALVFSVPIILISDVIMAWGDDKIWKESWLGYIIFSFWPIGTFIPFYFMRTSYLSFIQEKYGVEYETTVAGLFSVEMIPVIIITTVIGAVIGAYIAKMILKKHFKRT